MASTKYIWQTPKKLKSLDAPGKGEKLVNEMGNFT